MPTHDGAKYYVCGPTGLVDGIRWTLAEFGVDARDIVYESFPGYEHHDTAEPIIESRTFLANDAA